MYFPPTRTDVDSFNLLFFFFIEGYLMTKENSNLSISSHNIVKYPSQFIISHSLATTSQGPLGVTTDYFVDRDFIPDLNHSQYPLEVAFCLSKLVYYCGKSSSIITHFLLCV